MRDLVLDGRVPPQLALRDQAEERQQELVQLGHGAVREDHRPRWVDPDRQVVEHQAQHVLADRLGRVPVGQYLVVGDEDEQLRSRVLQPHPVLEGAEVVAKVQVAGRPVASQDPERVRLLPDPPLNLR
jgi:hypothetical protein